MAEGIKSLMLDSFLNHPARLLKTAKLLGSLKAQRIGPLLDKFRAESLYNADISKLKPEEAKDLFESAGVKSPIPKRLRDHIDGKTVLSGTSIRRHMESVAGKLDLARLELLESMILSEIGSGLTSDRDRSVTHALQLLASIPTNRNRRGFRRFLKAYLSGDEDFLERHPASVAWFAKHSRIDAEVWKKGLDLSRETKAHGAVRISLEQDPLEALKLGTNVGSCLGLGGMYDYSAVAVVLDINKQVLYARDNKGTVLARQLVTVSEGDELVCFEIYPESACRELKALFQEYDSLLAETLRIELNKDGEYTIEHILSSDWYDDYVLDFKSGDRR